MSSPLPPHDSGFARLVVNAVGDAAGGRLAESRFVERPFLPGGEHNLYELAFAASALGYDVELRGWLDRPSFERMADGAGTAPRTDLPPRRPEADDLVVVPEGWRDPLDYARLLLSPARLAIFVLAAPGLFGWPFVESWEAPDPLTVDLERLARAEHFRGMAACGLRLLTHSPGLVEAAEAAGVDCAFVGTGRPNWSPPDVPEKTVDVAAVLDNRWGPFATGVLDELEGVTVDPIETVSNAELVARLARARILVWPSRIEGHATIPWEARGVGCVPVALSSNRFAVGLDPAHGAVLVDTVPELAPAIRGLLEDPQRLAQLAKLGRETAPAEVDWESYLQRVGRFLRAPGGEDAASGPRAGMGDALGAWIERRAQERHEQLQEKASEVAVASEHLTEAMRKQEAMLAEIEHWRTVYQRLEGRLEETASERDRLGALGEELRVELEKVRAEKDRVTAELRGLLARRSVRAALRVAETVRRDGD